MADDWARPVVHWEIVARNPDRQARFYRELFNWEVGDGPSMAIPPGLGGPEPGPDGNIRGGQQVGVVLYIQVADLQETVTRAEVLGGRVTAQPFELPSSVGIAFIEDPEGNAIGLVQQ